MDALSSTAAAEIAFLRGQQQQTCLPYYESTPSIFHFHKSPPTWSGGQAERIGYLTNAPRSCSVIAATNGSMLFPARPGRPQQEPFHPVHNQPFLLLRFDISVPLCKFGINYSGRGGFPKMRDSCGFMPCIVHSHHLFPF